MTSPSNRPVTEKTIAVLLASGNQGTHVIKSLLKTKPSPNRFNIIGLTRDPSSTKCKQLLKDFNSMSSKHSVSFMKCNIYKKDNLISIFKNNNIWGVYCVTYATYDGTNKEEIQGKICIDAAIESGVSFFIFSSVVAASTAPKGIGHVNAKYEIDKYLSNKCENNKHIFIDGWTIIRTTYYMNNLFTFHKPQNGYLTIPVIRSNIKYAVVALTNIGDIVAAHFVGDIKINTITHSYDCIGDDISGQQMCDILNDVSSSRIKYSNFDIVLYVLYKFGIPLAVDLIGMFTWYDSDIIHGNMKQCYDDLPHKMINFKQFANTHFKDKNLDETLTRKIVKYSSIIAAGTAIASIVYWYLKKNK